MTESRIGIIKSVTTSDVKIHWNSDGPATYVFDELPDDLVLAKGRIVYAKCRRDGRIVSARSEPAVRDEEMNTSAADWRALTGRIQASDW